MKTSLAVCFAATFVSLTAISLSAESFADIRAKAKQLGETEEGKGYEKRCSTIFAKSIQAALQECTKDTVPPYRVIMVLVIAADGTTERVLPAPDQPVSACVAKKLTGLKLPAPPKPAWLISVNIAVEQ